MRWRCGDEQTESEADAKDAGLGVHYVDLPTTELAAGAQVIFTFYWVESKRWEGVDFTVAATLSQTRAETRFQS